MLKWKFVENSKNSLYKIVTRQLSSHTKDDFSTPPQAKDPADSYVQGEIVHEAFEAPRKISKRIFRKFKSPNEVLGPNADKSKEYKNPEYFSYHRYSFVNLQRATLKLRKQRIEELEEAESDAEFDAQLEEEWDKICEKTEEDIICPEVKCVEKNVEEIKCASTDKPPELKCVAVQELPNAKETDTEEEQKTEQAKEDQKIEQEKQISREEQQKIEEECNRKKKMEIKKFIEKCKREIIDKKRIEEKRKRLEMIRTRDAKYKEEALIRIQQMEAKIKEAEHLKQEEEKETSVCEQKRDDDK